MTQALGILALSVIIFVMGIVDYIVALTRYQSLGSRKELVITMKVYGSASALFALLAAIGDRMKHLTIIAALFLLVVSADLDGTARMERENKRCAIIGKQVDRDGVISDREARRIARWECKKTGGVWVSARFYQA